MLLMGAALPRHDGATRPVGRGHVIGFAPNSRRPRHVVVHSAAFVTGRGGFSTLYSLTV